MKESFKKGFGWIVGLYAGLTAVGVLNELINKKPDKPKEDSEEEET